MNSTTRILLVICGVAINCFAIATWAFIPRLHGSIWLLLAAFVGLLGPTSTILDCKSGHRDHDILQVATGYYILLPLVAAGSWLFAPHVPNSNWVLALFVLSSLGAVHGCKKMGRN